MSRFPSEWLALREPIDIQSRDEDVLSACAETFEKLEALSICDLGAGTGASIRALARHLPQNQRWLLVDHDAKNLSRARNLMQEWSDTCSQKRDTLTISHGEHSINIDTLTHDFSAQISPWSAGTNLITASALLDLTSKVWIQNFVRTLSADKLPLLATLNFDGYLLATPQHEFDEDVFAAFRNHQRTDKGFGPAAGPDAPAILRDELDRAGYEIVEGNSPWRMTSDSQNLMHETLAGISSAAIDLGTFPKVKIHDWLQNRLSNTDSLIVGHRDIFAQPPR